MLDNILENQVLRSLYLRAHLIKLNLLEDGDRMLDRWLYNDMNLRCIQINDDFLLKILLYLLLWMLRLHQVMVLLRENEIRYLLNI